MFRKLLIANRGEIAVRIMRTAKTLGVPTVAIYSDADRDAMHTEMADEAFRVGAPAAAQSYLDQDSIIIAAKKCGADAVHPGYGFLAENPDFAERVARAGLVFVGPPASAIRAMGLKDEAKRIMQKAGVPLLPGYHGGNQELPLLAKEAQKIGYPLLIKPTAGGGGKGMRLVASAGEFVREAETARREAISAFGDGNLLLEKFLPVARHIEVQIMADTHGNVVHLFERDCSLQRRHQKVVEEAPAPGMTSETRAAMCDAAVSAARQVGYVGAGTVEFIADVGDGLRSDRFYFMEMNTRLQVEHPVTEMVTGLDLVELQLRVACGDALPFLQGDVVLSGHAIETRLYAEDPARDFQPQTGRIVRLEIPEVPGLRADMGVRAGDAVSPYYDPMIGKLIVHGQSRETALERLRGVLASVQLSGLRTNLGFLGRLMSLDEFTTGDVSTGLIADQIKGLVAPTEVPMEAAAVALLFAFGHLNPPRSHSPFETLRGFRLWGGETQTIALVTGGEQRCFSLGIEDRHFIVSADEKSLRFAVLGSDHSTVRLDCGDRVVVLSYSHHEEWMTVAFHGGRHEFKFTGQAPSETESNGSGMVTSPVPGLVARLIVKKGDRVRRGDVLAIVEAMKMEFQIKAERDGIIANVHASEGSQITEGSLVAEIGEQDG